jgi:Ala-tRNA(Pro) deacylase
MGMSITLREYLESLGMAYDLVRHEPTGCSSETAHAAHIPGRKLAKSVVVEDDRECMAVVVPSTHYVALSGLAEMLGRSFYLTTEDDLSDLFNDCEQGAVPAAAQAYGLKVLVDDSLLECDEVYFEAGDHRELVHMSGDEFQELMALAGHGDFGRPG